MLIRFVYINLLLLPTFGLAQDNTWPIKYQVRYAQIAPIISGKIITIRNDTIEGLIKQIPGEFPILPTSKPVVLEINRDSILKIVLNGHSILENSRTTEIINLGHRLGFWRIISQNEHCGIYDNVLTAPSYVFGNRMILFSDNRKYRIYSSLSYVLHNGNTIPMVKRFIRKRYKSFFKFEKEESAEDFTRLLMQLEAKLSNSKI